MPPFYSLLLHRRPFSHKRFHLGLNEEPPAGGFLKLFRCVCAIILHASPSRLKCEDSVIQPLWLETEKKTQDPQFMVEFSEFLLL